MNEILKALILYGSIKKWREFKKFRHFFEERDVRFDEVIKFIEEWYAEYDMFPNYQTFETQCNSSGQARMISYVKAIVEDHDVRDIEEDLEFVSHLSVTEQTEFQLDLAKTFQEAQVQFSSLGKKTKDNLAEETDVLITRLHKIRDRALRMDEGVSSLLFGKEATKEMNRFYKDIKQRRSRGDDLYYTLGIKHFDPVQIKRGDLVVVPAYTSHGKSILLREIAYRCAVEYRLNVAFFSFEMSRDVIRSMFLIHHANNRAIFPHGEDIPYSKFKIGALSEAQERFLRVDVAPDLNENKNYGTIYIEQPNKARYTLVDLQAKIKELEGGTLPIQVVVIDYLSMMSPVMEGAYNPTMSDYNDMVRQFKNMALAHRNVKGEPSPFIAVTACQVSRDGLERAIKNKNLYDLPAIYMYSEFEKSADIIITVLMTPEMKTSSLIRFQNLKTRDGEVVSDAKDMQIALDLGFTLRELEGVSQGESGENMLRIVRDMAKDRR